MAFRPQTRRRVLAVGLAGCLAIAVVDQAAPSATAPLRRAAAEIVSPVQDVFTGHDDEIARLTRERDAARRSSADTRSNAADLAALRTLRGSVAADGRTFVAAQVIGFTPGVTVGRLKQVTIDAGSSDGVRTNLTVIAAGGLVGRVVSVSTRSATVQLLTDPSSVVGVRVGDDRLLASLASTAPAGLPGREAGLLTVRIAGQTPPKVGDRVTNLGSIEETPFVREVPVGTVVAVDPDRGQGGPTAVVRPAVDPTRLDLVGVVFPSGSVPARPAIRGGS